MALYIFLGQPLTLHAILTSQTRFEKIKIHIFYRWLTLVKVNSKTELGREFSEYQGCPWNKPCHQLKAKQGHDLVILGVGSMEVATKSSSFLYCFHPIDQPAQYISWNKVDNNNLIFRVKCLRVWGTQIIISLNWLSKLWRKSREKLCSQCLYVYNGIRLDKYLRDHTFVKHYSWSYQWFFVIPFKCIV